MVLSFHPNSVVPICQVDWKLHIDSSSKELQLASHGKLAEPYSKPVVDGEEANTKLNTMNYDDWKDILPKIDLIKN